MMTIDAGLLFLMVLTVAALVWTLCYWAGKDR